MCGFLTVGSKELEIDVFDEALGKIEGRGPDMVETSRLFDKTFGFNRLAIMDLSEKGMQPFSDNHTIVVCNGEIYNYPELKKNIIDEYTFKSSSDCEVLIPLYRKYDLDTLVRYLDGEYAFCLYDALTDKMMAARDPIGIRPMFYGYTEKGTIAFGSEAKALMPVCKEIMPFPPGHYYDGEKFVCFNDVADVKLMHNDDVETIALNLRVKLIEAIKKRLQSDAPVGYLLSGGLDSSLVCAIGQRITDTPIKTFAIGMETDPIDLKYAKEVAEFLGTDHTEVIMTKEDVLGSLREVIRTLETWDITTIRASIGMYLLCKYIHEHTDLKVILTGEVSDELFGYKYTDFAPNSEEFQKESEKRVRELYMYDVLRADRCISGASLEGRVPFADKNFVKYVLSLDPKRKMNTYGIGKYLLRKAFEGDYLPRDILMREKAAFSDAVGHSMVDYLKEYAESIYSDEEYERKRHLYLEHTPFTKESLLYREIFEEYYPSMSNMITDFWMPNKSWQGCNVDDPSARVLKNYGNSGK